MHPAAKTAMNVIVAKPQTRFLTSAFIRSLPLAPARSLSGHFLSEFLMLYEQILPNCSQRSNLRARMAAPVQPQSINVIATRRGTDKKGNSNECSGG
jgi:hypothetical protein